MSDRSLADVSAAPDTSPVRGAQTVFSDYMAMLGGRVGSSLLSLISVFVTTRVLSPRGYGTLAYFNVVSLLLFTVSSAWTGTAVARYAREELEHRGTMTSVTWARLAINSPLFVLCALAVVALQGLHVLPHAFTWSFVALSLLYGMAWILSDHLIYILEASGRMKVSAACLTAAQAAMLVALGIILLVGATPSPLTVALLILCASAAVSAFLVPILWRQGVWPPTYDGNVMRRMLRLSLPLIAFTVSQYVVRSVDFFVIGALKTQADVGVYAVAYQGYSVLAAVTLAAPPVLTPLFVSLRAANRHAGIRTYLDRTVFQLCFVAAILCAVATSLVFPVVSVVFGSGFAGAARPLAVLLCALVLLLGGNLVAPALVLHERGRAIAGYNVAAALVNVIGDIVFIGPLGLGITGAAVATTLATGVIFVGYVHVAQRDAGLRFRWRPMLLTPVIAGVIPAMILSGAARVAVSLAAGLVVGLIAMRALHPFGAEDAELVSALDIPSPLRRMVLRGLAFASR